MIQITNMPRVIIRNDQSSPTTPVVDADSDHDDESSIGRFAFVLCMEKKEDISSIQSLVTEPRDS